MQDISLAQAFRTAAQKANRGLPRPDTPQRARLIFALDATMSRQPSWDLATHLQAGMFEAASKIGGLDVQLVYFRGNCRPMPGPSSRMRAVFRR